MKSGTVVRKDKSVNDAAQIVEALEKIQKTLERIEAGMNADRLNSIPWRYIPYQPYQLYYPWYPQITWCGASTADGLSVSVTQG